jgi:hypothetical protein
MKAAAKTEDVLACKKSARLLIFNETDFNRAVEKNSPGTLTSFNANCILTTVYGLDNCRFNINKADIAAEIEYFRDNDRKKCTTMDALEYENTRELESSFGYEVEVVMRFNTNSSNKYIIVTSQ